MGGKAILDAVLDVAKATAPLVGPGGAAAVALAERVVELIDTVDGAVKEGVTPELVLARADLDKRIAQINASVDDTVARLRGED